MNRRRLLAKTGMMAGTGALARVIQVPQVSTANLAGGPQGQSLAASESQRESLLSVFDFETEAHKRIPHGAWERISGGAADEITLRWNREAYDHIRLKPRILVDVSMLDTRVSCSGSNCGSRFCLPLLGARDSSILRATLPPPAEPPPQRPFT